MNLLLKSRLIVISVARKFDDCRDCLDDGFEHCHQRCVCRSEGLTEDSVRNDGQEENVVWGSCIPPFLVEKHSKPYTLKSNKRYGFFFLSL